MAKGRLDRALGQFAALLDEHGRGDAELLELFVRKKDEIAFASLVRRLGPMVLGVCRRVLGNEDDAEDAFQATFLVLARKAASVRPRGRVANWLYGVAYRTALEARRAAARRRAREAKAVPRSDANESHDDLRDVLDEELARLPDRYREVVVLCELQGLGRKDVARQLGCPEGTIASRLSRARSLLARRLTRRGFAPQGSGWAPLFAPDIASVSVPPSLASATINAGSLIAAGKTMTAGVASAQVAFLTERVVRTMLLLKLKTIAVLVLVVGMVGSGAGWAFHQRTSADQAGPQARAGSPVEAPAAADEDKSQKTIDVLTRQVRQLQDRVAALEAELRAKPEARQEVLYQGKPASFWIRQLQDRAPTFRMDAIYALAGISEVDPSVIPLIVNTLNDRDANVIGAAMNAIKRIGAEATPGLVAALKATKDDRSKLQLLEAIKSLGPDAKSAVPALISLLKDPDPYARKVVLQTLQIIGPDASAAVPALIDLVKNWKSNDWSFVVSAIGGIGPGAKAAVPALIELLKERKPVQVDSGEPFIPALSAVEALGSIGPDAKAAIPALLDYLKSEKALRKKEGSDSPKSPPLPSSFRPGSRPPGGRRTQGMGIPQDPVEYFLGEAIHKIDAKSVPQ